MRLSEIYSKNNTKPPISFEVFPPKNDEDFSKTNKLIEELKVLSKFNPQLISVTYGAGGTNTKNSLNLVRNIKNASDINIMPHFTCVNATSEFVESHLKAIKELGIENILALRGDIPEEMEHTNFEFKHASDIAEYIKAKTDLSIGVAGYPEGHNDSPNLISDIKYLKLKTDKGADAIFTQLFFDNEAFYRFVDLAHKQKIEKPIIAGIMPILNYKSLQKMLSMCKVRVPQNLLDKIIKYSEDTYATTEIGIEFASEQCEQLIKFGVSGLHFYTLNKAYSTSNILSNIL